jgi:hypothetical protein
LHPFHKHGRNEPGRLVGLLAAIVELKTEDGQVELGPESPQDAERLGTARVAAFDLEWRHEPENPILPLLEIPEHGLEGREALLSQSVQVEEAGFEVDTGDDILPARQCIVAQAARGNVPALILETAEQGGRRAARRILTEERDLALAV